MEIAIKTNYEEFILVVQVATTSPQTLRLILKVDGMENTELTNRYKTVNGKFTFEINCPLSKESATLVIYNEATGNIPSKSDNTFKVLKWFRIPLEKRFDVVDFTDRKLMSFINFCQKFCFNAGELKSGNYQSDDGMYHIEYLPQIIGDAGQPLNTCARINKVTGKIQVSMEKFDPMTVPMRMVIMCHEYSHFYINDNIENESEADLNALQIYLGLGYPRIEAHDAFIDAFMGAPYAVNGERYELINRYIDDFDNTKIYVS